MNEQPAGQPATNPMPEQTQQPVNQQSAANSGPRYVGVWYRFLARFLDGIFLSIAGSPFLVTIFIIVFKATLEAGKAGSSGDSVQFTTTQSLIIGACSVATVLLSAIYQIIMNASKMQGTFGKRILGIKITDIEGRRLSLGVSMRRYFFSEGLGIPYSVLGNSTNVATKAVSGVFGFLYFVYYIVDASIGGGDAKKQTLHDKLAKTYVVYR